MKVYEIVIGGDHNPKISKICVCVLGKYILIPNIYTYINMYIYMLSIYMHIYIYINKRIYI